MKPTTHLPTDDTKEILSKLKRLIRDLADLGDNKVSFDILDKILNRLLNVLVGPVLQIANRSDEPTSKR
jgi:hypothetical protein